MVRVTGGRLGMRRHSGASLLPMPHITRAVRSDRVHPGEIPFEAHGTEDPFFEVNIISFLSRFRPRA